MRMSLDPLEAMFLVQNIKTNNQKKAVARFKDTKRERAKKRGEET